MALKTQYIQRNMDHEDSESLLSIVSSDSEKTMKKEEEFELSEPDSDEYLSEDAFSSDSDFEVSKVVLKPRKTSNRKRIKKEEPATEKKIKLTDSFDVHIPSMNHKSDITLEATPNLFQRQDFSHLSLKSDHQNRPLWISPNSGKILFEAFSPLASQAQDFLTAVAEPVSRPKLIHEYKLTPYSLYAAVSVGLDPENIIKVLNKLSKTELPEALHDFIRHCTKSYAKIKLVLKQNRYFIEAAQADVIDKLLQDPIISSSKISNTEDLNLNPQLGTSSDLAPMTKFSSQTNNVITSNNNISDSNNLLLSEDYTAILEALEDELDELDSEVFSFEISNHAVESVKKRCTELDYPLLEEYAFREDQVNRFVRIDLKAKTTIRPYQEKCLNKMFGNGRARSGIIVLPCGAGKTLVGITAACTIKKSTLILCTSAVSVAQWRQQLLMWTSIKPSQIATFTSGNKEFYADNIDFVISTYSMVGNIKHRSHTSKKMMDFLQSREWGLLVLDEVHVVPANMFRQVVTKVAAHAKLGLTATLVREDDKISDLNFLIGPKLYEANWMDLAKQGHIANVECAEVWCSMTKEFYREYLRETSRRRALLYIMNPAKLHACQFLIKLHEDRGDKVIVFSDNVYALKAYALKLQKPFIYGATSQQERLRILQQFQHNPLLNTIFLSKVGDTSIDLPEANCLIQISAHYGSRRQEAQRLGRILRAKQKNKGVTGTNAYFYTLVSKDTSEMYYSVKRQQFLVDQGYVFKMITSLEGIDKIEDLIYPSKESQLELLQSVLMASEKDIDLDPENEEELIESALMCDAMQTSLDSAPRRTVGSMKSLSGADSMAYIEYNRPVAHQFRGKEWEKRPNRKSKDFSKK